MNAGFYTAVESYPDRLVKSVKPTLYLLWGGAFFVLLIGCVNVANLVLVRTRVRLKELATRLALGAGPAQVARQLVVENLLLTLAAAAAGLATVPWPCAASAPSTCRTCPTAPTSAWTAWRSLFTLGLSLAIGVVMGLLPVATVLRANLTSVLREEGRAASGGRGARVLRRTLVVAEVAFTFVLLVGAGLAAGQLPPGPGRRPRLRRGGGGDGLRQPAPHALRHRGQAAPVHRRGPAPGARPARAWWRRGPPTPSPSAAATATA